jgi:hypothetical protein
MEMLVWYLKLGTTASLHFLSNSLKVPPFLFDIKVVFLTLYTIAVAGRK